jgi:hypothetical protein
MEGGREEREGQREVDKERVVRMELWEVGGDNRETDFFSISHSVTSAQPHYLFLPSLTHLITTPLSSSNLFTMSLSLSLPPFTCPWHSVCPSPSPLHVGEVSGGRTESPEVRDG